MLSHDTSSSKDRSNMLFWSSWVFATTVAAFLAFVVMAISMIFTFGISVIASGVVLGYFVGWSQERVLRINGIATERSKWTQWTMVGLGLAFIVVTVLYLTMSILDGLIFPHIFTSNALYALLTTVVGGLITGAFQARSIGARSAKSLWLFLNGVGWPIATFLAIIFANSIVPTPNGNTLISFPQVFYFLIAGTISFAIMGVISATAMLRSNHNTMS